MLGTSKSDLKSGHAQDAKKTKKQSKTKQRKPTIFTVYRKQSYSDSSKGKGTSVLRKCMTLARIKASISIPFSIFSFNHEIPISIFLNLI